MTLEVDIKIEATNENGERASMTLSTKSVAMIQELVNREFDEAEEEYNKAKKSYRAMEYEVENYPFEELVEKDENGNGGTYMALPNQEERKKEHLSMEKELEEEDWKMTQAQYRLQDISELYGVVHWVLEEHNEEPDADFDFLKGDVHFRLIDDIIDD